MDKKMNVVRNLILVYRFKINWMKLKQKLKNTHNNYKKIFKGSKSLQRLSN